ncbi:hypothetical protein AB3N02_21965 [Priestia aryabhattai]|uniref:hypothetical protein n=1 Tax=Priestia aryabhattai TaxID=412384 RepID=UPI0039A0F282
MYLVDIANGLEHYQVKRENFETYVEAYERYTKAINEGAIAVKVFKELNSYSIFDKEDE